MNPETRSCQNCKNDFVIESEDFSFYKKMKVPSPTFCPDCRYVRRVTWRNERFLYSRSCDLCQKKIISIYRANAPFPVYCPSCWTSDQWDPMDYGVPFDVTQPFFDQLRNVLDSVPRVSVMHIGTVVDSPYANIVFNSKNIYMSSSVLASEDVYYSNIVDESREVFDCLNVKKGDNCYENVSSDGNYKSAFLVQSSSCIDSVYLFDCLNCQQCFMSSNLRNKTHVFRNVQMSKEEYDANLEKLRLGSFFERGNLRHEFDELVRQSVHKYADIIGSEAVVGDGIKNSRNIYMCHDAYGSENIRYGSRIVKSKDCQDIYGVGPNGEFLYEDLTTSLGTTRSLFSILLNNCQFAEYSHSCASSANLFGCVGLKQKKYCILNTQYSKEDYESLIGQIKEHMVQHPYVDARGRRYTYGEFFPTELSPFAYNETVAEESFPLTKEECLANGYQWEDHTQMTSGKGTIPMEDLPDDISEIQDSICQEILSCMTCSRNYKIVSQELRFYRTMNLPIPRACFYCRHAKRASYRGGHSFMKRACSHCGAQVLTNISSDLGPIVYCESCYQKEVL